MSWNHIWAIAKKELRGYFNSAVAFIFLATFLALTLFLVFWKEKFFARGVADVRPLFEWLPILLIFLVGALSMRLWSEEQKVGTIEVLLTLPLKLHELVLGKFLGGFLLVALALAMTLGLPLTVSLIGDVDWGPVFGGYFATLLLAAAYFSIGLCVSSTTDNQIVSLVLTTVFCALLYLPGAAAVSGATGYEVGEFLRSLGTGSRFDSIARGVIDLRDLAYWGGLVVFFLALNTVLLMAKRWSAGSRTRFARQSTKLSVLLLALNVVALQVWLAPFARARIDMTEGNRYSLSPVTKEVLSQTEEPLTIRGYFSEETHEKLAPLIPDIRDLLEEYRIAGGQDLTVEFIDPTKDEELQREALDLYGIEPEALPLVSRFQRGVVNAYFHILVQYGDDHEVIGLGQMIDVRYAADYSDFDVELGNLEYELTKSVKRLSSGFESIDSLFAGMSDEAELTFLVTPDTLPASWKQGADLLEKVAGDLAKRSGGKLRFEKKVPEGASEGKLATFEGHQVQPRQALTQTGIGIFYFHPILKIGDELALVELRGDMTEDDIRASIESALKRVAPGFLKLVGLYTPPPAASPPPRPGMPPQQPAPAQTFRQLQDGLGENYEVRPVDLSGPIDEGIDVLVIGGPANVGEEGKKAIDQFLMRGGSVIALAGRHRLDRQALAQKRLGVTPITTGLEELFDHYGVKLGEQLVLDKKSASFEIPVPRDLGGGRQLMEIQNLPYPFFARVRGQGLGDHLTTSGIDSLLLQYATPLEVDASLGEKPEFSAQVLVRSSDESWLQTDTNVTPDLARYPETGFPIPEEVAESGPGPHTLAVALVGSFSSYFASDPTEGGEDKQKQASNEGLLRASPPGTRLIVVGSSSFASDEGLQVGFQAVSREILQNIRFVQNLVDWSLEDVDLLNIRNRTGVRFLEIEEDQRRHWELINYGVVIVVLALVIGIGTMRRRALEPMALLPASQPLSGPEGADEEAEEDREDEAEEDDDEKEEEEEEAAAEEEPEEGEKP